VSEWERFKATALIQDYVQPDEIAKQCGVTIDTVWRWIRTEKIEASRFAHYRVSRPEFERFMQHRKHK
jgi:excisionase family DNA binding protein